MVPAFAIAYIKVDKSRCAVMRASFWRKLPAAAFRGLANVAWPISRAAALSCSNDAFGIYTSPRTSIDGARIPCSPLLLIRKGTSRTLRTLAVMFSPTRPSPRVAARSNWPFVYVSAIPDPSILSSQVIGTNFPKNSSTRSIHASSSFKSIALSSEYMRSAC